MLKNIQHPYYQRCFIFLLIVSGFSYFWLNKTLLYDFISSVYCVYLWLQSQFDTINGFDSTGFVWAPFLLVTGCMIFLMILCPVPPRLLRIAVIMVLWSVHTLYIVFRTLNTLRFDTIENSVVTLFFWMAEVLFYLCGSTLYIQLMFSTDRKPAADRYEKMVKSSQYQPWVDVFIPTYSEPVEMVRRTLIGCQAMEYRYKRIYLLDDRNRPEMRELTRDLNCFYVTRTENTHFKAGNINNALKQTDGELVAMFDADCIPLKNFLNRTVGFFQDQNMAMVITAQSFYNANMFSHNMMSLMEQSRIFRQSQCGRDKFNALLCFGTCFVVRRKAMEDIGGIPTETLSEDWATSIKLQAAGYQTCSLDEVLGVGAVAESMGEYIRQRMRWTQGTLQALFSSTNPFRIKGLTFMQRVIHSHGILHYLLNPFYISIIILPLLYFFFGFMPFYMSSEQFCFFALPFFSLNCLVFPWIYREYTARLSAMVGESFMAVPLSIAVLKTILRPFGWRFRPTPKGLYHNSLEMNWFIGAPLMVLVILLAVGIVYGYGVRYWFESQNFFYWLLLLSIIRIITLWMGIYASFDLPQRRRAFRFRHKLTCFFYGSEWVAATTVDISEYGLLVECKNNVEIQKIKDSDTIDIRDWEFMQIPVEFIRATGYCATFAFKKMPLETYRRLIEFLYCRPEQWDRDTGLDMTVLSAMGKAVMFEGIPRITNQKRGQKQGEGKIYAQYN